MKLVFLLYISLIVCFVVGLSVSLITALREPKVPISPIISPSISPTVPSVSPTPDPVPTPSPILPYIFYDTFTERGSAQVDLTTHVPEIGTQWTTNETSLVLFEGKNYCTSTSDSAVSSNIASYIFDGIGVITCTTNITCPSEITSSSNLYLFQSLLNSAGDGYQVEVDCNLVDNVRVYINTVSNFQVADTIGSFAQSSNLTYDQVITCELIIATPEAGITPITVNFIDPNFTIVGTVSSSIILSSNLSLVSISTGRENPKSETTSFKIQEVIVG